MDGKMTEFKPGETVRQIVGMPGPDYDLAEIVAKRDDGNYDIRFQVYGDGKWFDGVGVPDRNGIGGIFR
jgi:hypothetical protein